MSITLIELSQQLEGFANDLTGTEQGYLMGKLGTEALSLLKQRVQETGVNAEGEKFAPYSKKPMLVGKKSFVQEAAANTLLGSKKKRQKLEWVTIDGHRLAILPGGYKKLRDMQGRQTAFVDFVVTGRMWNNIKVTSPQAELNSGVAVIKATQELEKNKLAGNTARKGEILKLSHNEEKQLSGNYESWVEGLLKKRELK